MVRKDRTKSAARGEHQIPGPEQNVGSAARERYQICGLDILNLRPAHQTARKVYSVHIRFLFKPGALPPFDSLVAEKRPPGRQQSIRGGWRTPGPTPVVRQGRAQLTSVSPPALSRIKAHLPYSRNKLAMGIENPKAVLSPKPPKTWSPFPKSPEASSIRKFIRETVFLWEISVLILNLPAFLDC